jgi:hypothetical protein
VVQHGYAIVCGMVKYNMAGMVYGKIWYDKVWYGMRWYGIRYVMVRYGM